MNRLYELMDNLKSQFFTLLGKIEESPQFEKALLSFEALDPRYQKRVRAGLLLFGGLAIFLVFSLPVFSVLSAKKSNLAYYNLIGEMQNFNTTNNIVFQSAPRPQGWVTLPTATQEDLENSLTQFLANNGVPQVLVDIQKTPQGFNIKLEQISIRQAVYFVFQLDGWYPALKFQSLKVSVNKENPELLELAATLDFDVNEAGKLNTALGSQPAPGGDMPNYNSAKGPTSGINQNPQGGGSGGSEYSPPPPPSPSMGGDDFGADLPPPPPFEEDL